MPARALTFAMLICYCADATSGTVILPSDVSVAIAAEPSTALQPGQRITFTISVTNHGPEPVDRLPLGSSAIFDELDVFSASVNCHFDLVLSVIDLEDTFYFSYVWRAAYAEYPLAVGETRNCYLSLDYTANAPPVFPFTFAFPNWESDLDNSNNAATVNLERAAAAPAAVPALSGVLLLLLAALLILVGAYGLRAKNRSSTALHLAA